MPFRSFRGRYRRRFSATPRRSWGRSRVGTGEARRQIAQTHLETELVIAHQVPRDEQNPSFLVQALTPWSNAPAKGYDRTWELKGLIFQIRAHHRSYDDSAGNPAQGYILCSDLGQVRVPFGATFFVDAVEANSEAPASLTGGAPLGPFVTTPPIGGTTAPEDSSFMPTRMLKRKIGEVQVGFLSGQTSAGNAGYAFRDSVWEWSGTLRKRISVSGRQGLFLGFWGLEPVAGYPTGNDNAVISIQASIVFYYSLRR